MTWSNISVLTVNTNGIKKKSPIYYDLAFKFSVPCVQETKLADSKHISTFKLHLASIFKHKVFVNDPCWTDPREPTRCSALTSLALTRRMKSHSYRSKNATSS
ncbi:hypothetical protein Plhal304r1_c029g0096551 [Plasmopara halstedii]